MPICLSYTACGVRDYRNRALHKLLLFSTYSPHLLSSTYALPYTKFNQTWFPVHHDRAWDCAGRKETHERLYSSRWHWTSEGKCLWPLLLLCWRNAMSFLNTKVIVIHLFIFFKNWSWSRKCNIPVRQHHSLWWYCMHPGIKASIQVKIEVLIPRTTWVRNTCLACLDSHLCSCITVHLLWKMDQQAVQNFGGLRGLGSVICTRMLICTRICTS